MCSVVDVATVVEVVDDGADVVAAVVFELPPVHAPAPIASTQTTTTLLHMADKITMAADGRLNVPDEPILPFIRGDGTGVDIWPAAQLVMDAAAKKHGKSIAWKEVLAGEKAF